MNFLIVNPKSHDKNDIQKLNLFDEDTKQNIYNHYDTFEDIPLWAMIFMVVSLVIIILSVIYL